MVFLSDGKRTIAVDPKREAFVIEGIAVGVIRNGRLQ